METYSIDLEDLTKKENLMKVVKNFTKSYFDDTHLEEFDKDKFKTYLLDQFLEYGMFWSKKWNDDFEWFFSKLSLKLIDKDIIADNIIAIMHKKYQEVVRYNKANKQSADENLLSVVTDEKDLAIFTNGNETINGRIRYGYGKYTSKAIADVMGITTKRVSPVFYKIRKK